MTSSSTSNCDAEFLIIGAGVLGVSLAYHLGRCRKRVIVIEREATPACHASGKNAGMFRQLYRHPALTDWAVRSRVTWPEEVKRHNFAETGSCIAGRTPPSHHETLFGERDFQRHNGTTVTAVSTPTDGLLDSPNYVNGLWALARRNSVNFKFGQSVKNIIYHNNNWHVESTSGERFSSNCLINASGAWINKVLEENYSHHTISATAYARHLFLVNNWSQGYMPTSNSGYFWDEEHNWYMRRWDQTSRLVSICDTEPATPEHYLASNRIEVELAEKLLDELGQEAHELRLGPGWHCFRTYTEDKLPVIGPDPDLPNYYWLAAFGGFGMSTSFAATYDLSNLLITGRNALSEDFLPVRMKRQAGDDLTFDIKKSAVSH